MLTYIGIRFPFFSHLPVLACALAYYTSGTQHPPPAALLPVIEHKKTHFTRRQNGNNAATPTEKGIKDKFEATLTVTGAVFIPGRTVSGTVWINARHMFQYTAITARLQCPTTISGTLDRATHSRVWCDRTEAVGGSTSSPGGVLSKEMGTSECRFSVQIPAAAPPSWESKSYYYNGDDDPTYGLKLRWSVSVTVEMPFGASMTVGTPIRVLPAIRADAYAVLRTTTTPEFSILSSPARGLFSSSKGSGGSFVRIKASVFPSALVLCDPGATGGDDHHHHHPLELPAHTELPAAAPVVMSSSSPSSPPGEDLEAPLPNSYTARVRVNIANNTMKAIKGVSIALGKLRSRNGKWAREDTPIVRRSVALGSGG